MYSKIFALLAVTALVLGVFAMTQPAKPVMAASDSKCFTLQAKDRTSTATSCSPPSTFQQDQKKQCKEITDNKEFRCSSSQTGNGEFGNFFKP